MKLTRPSAISLIDIIVLSVAAVPAVSIAAMVIHNKMESKEYQQQSLDPDYALWRAWQKTPYGSFNVSLQEFKTLKQAGLLVGQSKATP